MKTNRLLLACLFLILCTWGAAQFVNFDSLRAYSYDPALEGYHCYVWFWIDRCGLGMTRGVASKNRWVYKSENIKQHTHVGRAPGYNKEGPILPYIHFDVDLQLRWFFIPFWLMALAPAAALMWPRWMRWRRARKAKGRGFAVVNAHG
ncbi:MAG TPA: hypothetical protein VH370_19935 [Humisphaera sp.]|jgi:hypothetical protein|nr:hypothetical protein [Humisphaera sp.]